MQSNRYKTGNNIDAQETGFIKDINEQHPNGVLVQHGEYQYEAPNGEVVKVQYTADGNCYNAQKNEICSNYTLFFVVVFFFVE